MVEKEDMSENMKYYGITDIGKKYDHNEDYFLLPEPNKKYGIEKINKDGKGELFILCDGMGGGNSGEVVSELTANWIMKDYYSNNFDSLVINERLDQIIYDVNQRIVKLSREHKIYSGMGSTLLCLVIYNSRAYIKSVGDSRIYLLRRDLFNQITEDDSEVWQLYKNGTITKEEMAHHPNKHIINNAIGNKKGIRINGYELDTEKDDIFLMCSDGLTDMLNDNEIKEIIQKKVSLERKCKRLVKMANKKGGKDNITVILIEN